MNNREVMQQALEALELAKLNGKAGMYPAEIEEIAAAITTLRAALAEQCQCGDRPAAECPGEWEPGCDLGANEAHVKVHEPQETKEKGACASYAQTPSRQGSPQGEQRERAHQAPDLSGIVPAPQRQPELHPVTGEELPTSTAGWLHYVTDRTSAAWQEGYERGLKREGQRQPLTEEQIRELSQQHKFDSRMEKFVRIIERAHGIGGKE